MTRRQGRGDFRVPADPRDLALPDVGSPTSAEVRAKVRRLRRQLDGLEPLRSVAPRWRPVWDQFYGSDNPHWLKIVVFLIQEGHIQPDLFAEERNKVRLDQQRREVAQARAMQRAAHRMPSPREIHDALERAAGELGKKHGARQMVALQFKISPRQVANLDEFYNIAVWAIAMLTTDVQVKEGCSKTDASLLYDLTVWLIDMLEYLRSTQKREQQNRHH